jgi:small-conductance mechanosensitive channel
MDNLIGQSLEQNADGDVSTQLIRIAIAVAAFVVIVIVAKYASAGVQKFGERVSHSPAIGNLFATLLRVIAFVVALFVALRVLQLDGVAFSLLAGAGVVGIVIGFALQDIAANFISGIILAIQRPFRVGHLIETNDVYGIVRRINLRSTEVRTLDGQLVHIPNKNVLLNVVVDYNYIPFRRVDLDIGVSYGSDLAKVQKITCKTVQSLELCDKERPVELFFREFGNSAIIFEVRFWTAFENEVDFLEARSQAVMAIQKAYQKHAIEIPYPITTVLEGSARHGATSVAS